MGLMVECVRGDAAMELEWDRGGEVMSEHVAPLDIKSEAIVLLCLGHSSRTVEKMLRTKYPGTRIPRYATLSRWLSTAERTRMAKSCVTAMWLQAMVKASLILNDRIEEELSRVGIVQLMKSYERIQRIVDQSRHVTELCACANR